MRPIESRDKAENNMKREGETVSKTCIDAMSAELKPIRERLEAYSDEAIREWLTFMLANNLLNRSPDELLKAIQDCIDNRNIGKAMDWSRDVLQKLIDLRAVIQGPTGIELHRDPLADADFEKALELWSQYQEAERRIGRLARKLHPPASPVYQDLTGRAYADRAGKARSPFKSASAVPVEA
jgi:hypothetical protein